MAIALPPLSPGRYPDSPPSTPPLPQFSKEYQSFVYSKGLASQQHFQYTGNASRSTTVQEGSTEDVQLQKERILSGQALTYTNGQVSAGEATSSHLLPSHMQRTAPRSALTRAPLTRQATHTVSFADEVAQAETLPSTPKGHPSPSQRLGRYVDIEKRMQQVETGKAKLMGYFGGNGSESKHGKVSLTMSCRSTLFFVADRSLLPHCEPTDLPIHAILARLGFDAFGSHHP